MTYNKGNKESAVKAATRLASTTGKSVFVFPTYFGLTVDRNKPAFAKLTRYIEVAPTGTVIEHVPQFENMGRNE